jgi:hypothetical protein
MNFGEVITALKAGNAVRRKSWCGDKNYSIRLFVPCKDDLIPAHTYCEFIKSADHIAPRDRPSWVPSQTDMLADDWQILR